MADSAFMTAYREETIAGFEYGESRLGAAVTTQAQISGNSAVFLISDTGGEETITRGLNGDIPYGPDNLTQVTCTLAEYHAATQRTKFNLFASQPSSGGAQLMATNVRKRILRQKDALIITALATGTLDVTFATDASHTFHLAMGALGNEEVDTTEEENLFFVVTPAYERKMMEIASFASADYVDVKPLVGPVRNYRRYGGANWITHPRLPGNGTSSEKCFLFHRDAIGAAMDTGGMDFDAGYESKHQRSWARASMFMGAQKLQNSGIIVVSNDGSGYVAS